MSNSGFNSGFNSGTGNTGSMGGVTTGPGNSGTGSSTGSNTDFSTKGSFGTQTATDDAICAHCGQTKSKGLEQFLGRLGITEEMLGNLKGQFQNVDIDEYMNTAREYLKDGGTKASTYAKDNPGKIAAGVAALALGAGLIYAAVNRDK